MPKHTQSLLQLSGKELRQELDRLRIETPKTRAFWTPKEDEILTALYHKVGNKKLADLLNRPIDALQKRAMRLGLTGDTS